VTEPAASPRVLREWGNRVEAEYRSSAMTQHLTLWLIQMGTSPDLIREGLRIVDDELVHAELSHGVFAAGGGTELPALERGQLELPRQPERTLELDVTHFGVQIFCLGETVAVPLFSHMRRSCTVAPAREALDRILRDEVRHRQFGWDLLDQLLELEVADLVVAQIDRDLPAMFAELERSYGAAAGPDEPVTDDDRAWGLAPPSEYAAILEETFVKDYLPRFAERDIDALPAWEQRLALLERWQSAN